MPGRGSQEAKGQEEQLEKVPHDAHFLRQMAQGAGRDWLAQTVNDRPCSTDSDSGHRRRRRPPSPTRLASPSRSPSPRLLDYSQPLPIEIQVPII